MSRRYVAYLVCVQDFIRFGFEIWGYRPSIRRSLEMKIAFVRVVVQRCDIAIARDEIEHGFESSLDNRACVNLLIIRFFSSRKRG